MFINIILLLIILNIYKHYFLYYLKHLFQFQLKCIYLYIINTNLVLIKIIFHERNKY